MQINNTTLYTNIKKLFEKYPFFHDVVYKLNSKNVRWAIFAGSYVSIVTGYRETNDIDIIVHDDDLVVVRELFPFAHTIDTASGILIYLGKNHDVEFTSHADFWLQQKKYMFRLTENAVNAVTKISFEGFAISLANPVDTIIVKSILQRGPEHGKHDSEDIKQLFANIQIDNNYLNLRLNEVGDDDRIINYLKNLGVIQIDN